MKKFSILLLFSLALCSCDPDSPTYKTTKEMPFRFITEFEYKGHSYISFAKDYGQGGVGGVVHNPDCKCKHE